MLPVPSSFSMPPMRCWIPFMPGIAHWRTPFSSLPPLITPFGGHNISLAYQLSKRGLECDGTADMMLLPQTYLRDHLQILEDLAMKELRRCPELIEVFDTSCQVWMIYQYNEDEDKVLTSLIYVESKLKPANTNDLKSTKWWVRLHMPLTGHEMCN